MTKGIIPDVEEFLGLTHPVPVKHTEPIDTRDLPTHVSFGARNVDTNGGQILSRNPYRKSATIIALDQDIYFGEKIGDVQSSTGSGMAKWPALTPLVIGGANEVYAASSTGSTDITLVVEIWQTGEDET